MPLTPQHKGIALSISAAFWGAVFLLPYKAAAEAAPHVVVILAMLSAAAVFNTIATLVMSRGRLRIDRTAVLAALLLALGTVIGNIGVAGSVARVEPAITSVVLQTQIILVALAEPLLLKVRISGALIAGSALALCGFLIMQAPWQSVAAGGGDVAGALWALMAALVFALMLIVTRHFIARIDALAVNALRLWMAVAALALWPGTAAGVVALDGRVWLLAIAAAACGPTASRLMLMYATHHISASQVKLTTLVAPIFALLLGWAAFGQWPSGRELLGGTVILLGVALPLLMQRWTAGATPREAH